MAFAAPNRATERPAERSAQRGLIGPIVVAVATAVTLLVNFLANTLPINGQTTADISDRFEVYFVPAGYVFSIWGVIYLGLVAYTVYQLLPRVRDGNLLRALAPWYVVTALANSAWIFAWHYNQFLLSILLMLVLLVSLLVIYLRLRAQPPASRAELWAVHVPFRIYLGWISVATIANATVVLKDMGWDGFGIAEPVWGVIMIAVAGLLGILVSLLRADIAYALVFVWALVGIAVRFGDMPMLWIAAALAALLVALSLVYSVPRLRAQRRLK